MVELDDMEVMKILAHATNTIAKGEVLQLTCVDQVETNIEEYLRVIQYKKPPHSSKPYECTAVLADCDSETVENLAMYGRNIGLAFQISDDVLDYVAESNEQIGKKYWRRSSKWWKITLPFIYAFQNHWIQKRHPKRYNTEEKIEDFLILKDIIFETNAFGNDSNKAIEYVNLAKENVKVIENTEVANLLTFLADFSIKRKKVSFFKLSQQEPQPSLQLFLQQELQLFPQQASQQELSFLLQLSASAASAGASAFSSAGASASSFNFSSAGASAFPSTGFLREKV